MNFNHKLMNNNYTNRDMVAVKKLLKNKNIILTQSKKVEEFEKKWSKWLKVKYSTFVNSGSSANYISISILKALNKNKNKNEIIVPSLTWVSDINSVIMNGYKPVFVDIDLENLSMSTDQVLKKINKRTLAVFITHAQGFNGLTNRLLPYDMGSYLTRSKENPLTSTCYKENFIHKFYEDNNLKIIKVIKGNWRGLKTGNSNFNQDLIISQKI